VKADGSLASLASDTGALSSAMHTSERHQLGMAAAKTPEASPLYTYTTTSPLYTYTLTPQFTQARTESASASSPSAHGH